MSITIVIPVYNQYELFRQCIESIQHNIWDEVERIIIVDDYSDPDSRLREYQDYINATYNKIKLIKADEYRMSVHVHEHHETVEQRRGGKAFGGMNKVKRTRGHGFALQTGINEAKTDFIMCMDADCIILKNAKGMIYEIEQIFKSHENIACIGQLSGLMTNENIIQKEKFAYNMGGKKMGCGGYPGSPAFFIKKIPNFKIATHSCHRGWALSVYIKELFENDFNVMNYPVFSRKKVFHVGGGILNAARFYGEKGKNKCCWGMLRDGRNYGGRRGPNVIADWYQGRYILDMDTQEYMKYLEGKYNKPFSDKSEPLDESLLYTAEKEISPERI